MVCILVFLKHCRTTKSVPGLRQTYLSELIYHYFFGHPLTCEIGCCAYLRQISQLFQTLFFCLIAWGILDCQPWVAATLSVAIPFALKLVSIRVTLSSVCKDFTNIYQRWKWSNLCEIAFHDREKLLLLVYTATIWQGILLCLLITCVWLSVDRQLRGLLMLNLFKIFFYGSGKSLIITTEKSIRFLEDKIYYPQQRGKKKGSYWAISKIEIKQLDFRQVVRFSCT